MSEHVFDALTRRTAVASRRGYVHALGGLALGGLWSSLLRLDDVEARKKGSKKKKRNRNKKRNQRNRSSSSCTPSCAGKVCGDDGCGGSCGTCGPTQLCAQSQCVVGQGTCDPGQDICVNFEHTCGNAGGGECYCRTSMSNLTRCGQSHEINDEQFCASDAECALFFPDTPGAFCAQASGQNCPGGVGLCYAPCPDS
jgi:hypothetical protein